MYVQHEHENVWHVTPMIYMEQYEAIFTNCHFNFFPLPELNFIFKMIHHQYVELTNQGLIVNTKFCAFYQL